MTCLCSEKELNKNIAEIDQTIHLYLSFLSYATAINTFVVKIDHIKDQLLRRFLKIPIYHQGDGANMKNAQSDVKIMVLSAPVLVIDMLIGFEQLFCVINVISRASS